MTAYYRDKKIVVNNYQKLGMSLISGAFGAMVGNPFDVALVRRQASVVEEKGNYRNTYHAFKTIINK